MEDTPNSRHGGQVPVLSRWTFLRLAGMAATGTALSACTSLKPKPTSRSGDEVQLVYEDWRTDWLLSMAQKMLEEFRAAHPHIRVFYTPDPESVEHKLLADMQDGTAPDVFQGYCTHFPMRAQMRHTFDLRPYVEADLDLTTIDEGTGLSTSRSSPQTGTSSASRNTTARWLSAIARTSWVNPA